MNDRELTELAAIAAGIDGYVCEDWTGVYFCTPAKPDVPRSEPAFYRWLHDDGDAMRLAAALRLHIKPGKHLGDGCTVESQRDGIAGATAFYDDKNEQMRRAIVLVAVEIGKSKLAAPTGDQP